MKGLYSNVFHLSSSYRAIFSKTLLRKKLLRDPCTVFYSVSSSTLFISSNFYGHSCKKKTKFASDKKKSCFDYWNTSILKGFRSQYSLKNRCQFVEKRSICTSKNSRRCFHSDSFLRSKLDDFGNRNSETSTDATSLAFVQHAAVLEEIKVLPEVTSVLNHAKEGNYQNALMELDMLQKICNQMMGAQSKYMLTLNFLEACLYMELNKFCKASEILEKILLKNNENRYFDPLTIPGAPNEDMTIDLFLTLISCKVYEGNLLEAGQFIKMTLKYCDEHAESHTNLYSRIFSINGVVEMIKHGSDLGKISVDIEKVQDSFNSIEDNNLYPFFQKAVRLAESSEEISIALCNLGYYHYWRSSIWNNEDELQEAENTWIEAVEELEDMVQTLEAKLKTLESGNLSSSGDVYQLRKANEILGEIYLNLAELHVIPRMLVTFDCINDQHLQILDKDVKLDDINSSNFSLAKNLKNANKDFSQMLLLRETDKTVEEKINLAQEYASKGLAIQERLYGHNDTKLARSLMLLGRCYHMSGQAVSAEGLYRSAIDKLLNSGSKSSILASNGFAVNASALYEYIRVLSLYRLLLIEWDKREKDARDIEKQLDDIAEQLNSDQGASGQLAKNQLLIPSGLIISNRPMNTVMNRQQISQLISNNNF